MSVSKIKSVIIFIILASVTVDSTDKCNDAPIIGVLAQEMSHSLEQIYPNQYKSFIAASYVKFLEGGGARVVPVWIGREDKYYEDVVNNTNGILFPGGSTWFTNKYGYSEAGLKIYNLAIEENKKGPDHYFPLFGICLGMEFLIYAAAGPCAKEYRCDCDAKNAALPLEFKNDFRDSIMFKKLPKNIENDLRMKNITANFHQFCVTEKILSNINITEDWHVLSVNHDDNGVEFISALEHKRYPFFGVQFHPEKNMYEWFPKKGITHSKEAVRAGQYFSQLFVNEARKSNHTYDNKTLEENELIYNYPVTNTGKDGSTSYVQCYLFKDKSDDENGQTVEF